MTTTLPPEVSEMVEANRVSYYETLLQVAAGPIRRMTEQGLPHEAVGIIADNGTVYPLINQRRSATEFMVSRVLVDEALTYLRGQNLTGVALYHSHPSREATPSEQDIAMMRLTPHTVYVIHGTDKIVAFVCDSHEADPRPIAEVPLV